MQRPRMRFVLRVAGFADKHGGISLKPVEERNELGKMPFVPGEQNKPDDGEHHEHPRDPGCRPISAAFAPANRHLW